MTRHAGWRTRRLPVQAAYDLAAAPDALTALATSHPRASSLSALNDETRRGVMVGHRRMGQRPGMSREASDMRIDRLPPAPQFGGDGQGSDGAARVWGRNGTCRRRTRDNRNLPFQRSSRKKVCRFPYAASGRLGVRGSVPARAWQGCRGPRAFLIRRRLRGGARRARCPRGGADPVVLRTPRAAGRSSRSSNASAGPSHRRAAITGTGRSSAASCASGGWRAERALARPS